MHTVVVDAHIEAAREAPNATSYLRDPVVLHEIWAVAGRSVDHPSYRPSRTTARDVSPFAFVAACVNDRTRARGYVERAGDWITYPWTMSIQPSAEYREMLRWVEGSS